MRKYIDFLQSHTKILQSCRIALGIVLMIISFYMMSGVWEFFSQSTLTLQKIGISGIFILSLLMIFGLSSARSFISLSYHNLIILRILLGVLVIASVIYRIPHISELFTDSGYMTRRDMIWFFGDSRGTGIHMMGGSYVSQLILLIIHLLLGVILILGYRTPLICFALFFMEYSLQNRNNFILNGGSPLKLLLLAGSCLLPLGAYFSVHNPALPKEKDIHHMSISSVNFIVALIIVYMAAGWWKTWSTWETGDGLYYVLQAQQYSFPWTQKLLDYPDLLRILSFAVLFMQRWGWVLFFVQWKKNPIGKHIYAIFFFGFHISTGVMMHLPEFSAIGAIYILSLLPGMHIVTRYLNNLSSVLSRIKEYTHAPDVYTGMLGKISTQILAFILLILLVIHGISLTPFMSNPQISRDVLRFTHLDHTWNMFSNGPNYSEWNLIAGELEDERIINLYTGKILSKERPTCFHCVHANYELPQLPYIRANQDDYSFLATGILTNKFEKWNDSHPHDPIVNIALIHVFQKFDTSGYIQPPEFKTIKAYPYDLDAKKEKFSQHLKTTGNEITQSH